MAEVAIPQELFRSHLGRNSAAEAAHPSVGLTPGGTEIAGRRGTGGDALSAFGPKSVLNVIEGIFERLVVSPRALQICVSVWKRLFQ
jgi:hypothetical protein